VIYIYFLRIIGVLQFCEEVCVFFIRFLDDFKAVIRAGIGFEILNSRDEMGKDGDEFYIV
jgi:hypothetical protein